MSDPIDNELDEENPLDAITDELQAVASDVIFGAFAATSAPFVSIDPNGDLDYQEKQHIAFFEHLTGVYDKWSLEAAKKAEEKEALQEKEDEADPTSDAAISEEIEKLTE